VNSPYLSTTRKRTRPPAAKALFGQLESYFDSSKLHQFDACGGRCLRRKGTLGAPGGYYIYDAQGELQCLILCIKSGGWRDPATIAREIYEHALSQRHAAPAIWLVFELDNVVLRRLAELSLLWGGSPYDKEGHWLFLSIFSRNTPSIVEKVEHSEFSNTWVEMDSEHCVAMPCF
jgi:hypothetical protein